MSDHPAAGSYCPSSAPDEPDATVFGVISGAPEKPTVVYLSDPVLVTRDLLEKLGDVPASEALRIAAPCRQGACAHFRDSQCSLITKIVRATPEASADASVPQCHLRDRCRWWAQEKVAACRRCPAIVTDDVYADELQWWIADASTSAEDFDPRDFVAATAAKSHGD